MGLPKISICIPAYEMGGHGSAMLYQLLVSAQEQDYPNKEIIVSDHTVDRSLKSICDKFPVVYSHCVKRRGSSSANINNAIDQAHGEFIKPMFQDDLFMNEGSLSYMYNDLVRHYGTWAMGGYKKYESNPSQLIESVWPPKPINWDSIAWKNGLGPPSGLLYKKCNLRFDEDLIWVMDCEFYYRLYKRFGLPHIIDNFVVLVRVWSGSVSNALVKPQLPRLFNVEQSLVQTKMAQKGYGSR